MRRPSLSNRRRQATLDVGYPLHPKTDCAADVAQLVGALLKGISELDHRMTHADVLQALEIATAVRLAMADVAAQPGAGVSLRLLDVEVGTGEEIAAGSGRLH